MPYLTTHTRARALAGYGGITPGGAFMALQDRTVWMPVVGGLVMGLAGRIVTSRGPVRMATSLGALGAVGYGLYRLWKLSDEIDKEMKTHGAAAVGERVGAGATENAKAVLASANPADEDMRNTLVHYSCYENAKRDYDQNEGLLNKWAGGWFGIPKPARDPMKDCALTPERLAIIKAAFAKISRADRARLDRAFAPGGALQDLGPAGA